MTSRRTLILPVLGLGVAQVMPAQTITDTPSRKYSVWNPTIEKAFKAVQDRRFQDAKALLKPCLEAIPNHFEAHYFLALMDFGGKDYPSALKHLDVSEQTLMELAKEFSAQEADMKARAQAAEQEALDNLSTASSRGQTRSLAGLNQDLKIAQDKAKPSKNLQQPYAVPADYLFFRGNVLLRLDRREEARTAYRRAVSADSTHANAWNNLIALGLGAKDSAGTKADLAAADVSGVVIRPDLKKAVEAMP